MLVWNVLPPAWRPLRHRAGGTVSCGWRAPGVVAGFVIVFMYRWAAAGGALHHEFANRAAAVDGEMTDVVGNMAIVKAFGGVPHEHRRFDVTVEREMSARRHSLRYLERLRIAHALVTVVLTIALLGWTILLWQRGAATTGDVILVCTLGLSVLHATRDLAVALVDVTQHMARFSEALSTLLIPHELCDRPGAAALRRRGASVTFEGVMFAFPIAPLFPATSASRRHRSARRSGRCLRRRQVDRLRSHPALLRHPVRPHPDRRPGRHRGHAAEPARAIAVVPQDVSLFHRSLLENIATAVPRRNERSCRPRISPIAPTSSISCRTAWKTMMGDRGFRLSGGQRQRIAIARAFLKGRPCFSSMRRHRRWTVSPRS